MGNEQIGALGGVETASLCIDLEQIFRQCISIGFQDLRDGQYLFLILLCEGFEYAFYTWVRYRRFLNASRGSLTGTIKKTETVATTMQHANMRRSEAS